MPLQNDIVGVLALYDPVAPWIWDENRSRVHGIVVRALYLFGPDNRAVFGDGVIHPRLYVLERDNSGEPQAKLVKEWSFDNQKALLLRSKRKKGPGWGYLLPLDWGDLDLAGKEIRMLVAFERSDGLVVKTKSQKYFRVPAGRQRR